MADHDITTRNEPDRGRIVAHTGDGTEAGVAEYTRDGSAYSFDHTVVEPEFEGQGVGTALAAAAVELVRSEGGATLVPQCSFIKAYVEEHPETHDVLAG